MRSRTPCPPPRTWICRRRWRRSGGHVSPRKPNLNQVMPANAGASSRDRPLSRAIPVALPLRDELAVGVGLETLDAAFLAVTGFLDAAERGLGCRDRNRIHAHHAGLDCIADHR